MAHSVAVKRALVSVSDKTDLIPFCRRLVRHGVQLISTGGTAGALREANLPVTGVDQVTGYPDQLAIQRTIGELYVKHFQPPKIPAEKPKKAGAGG